MGYAGRDALLPGPFHVRKPIPRENIVRTLRIAFLGDLSDFELTHLYACVWPMYFEVRSCVCLEFQLLGCLVEDPHEPTLPVEVRHRHFDTTLQTLTQRARFGQGRANLRVQPCLTRPFRLRLVRPFARGIHPS